MSATAVSQSPTVPSPGTVPQAHRRRGPRPARVIAFVVLAFLALMWLAPVAWAVITSLKPEAEAGGVPITLIPESGFTLDAYRMTLQEGMVPRWALNSLITSSVITFIAVSIAAFAGYALSRFRFSGRRLILVLIVLSIMIPAQILIVPLFQQMLTLNLVDTYWGIILPQIIAAPMVFILSRFFDQIPRELEEAALVDGSSRFRILRQIVLPLSRPILGAVAIFVFITSWNNFLWPFIVTNRAELMTLPVGLETVISAYGVQYAAAMAQAVLAALPLIVVFLFFQRQIIKSISSTGITGT